MEEERDIFEQEEIMAEYTKDHIQSIENKNQGFLECFKRAVDNYTDERSAIINPILRKMANENPLTEKSMKFLDESQMNYPSVYVDIAILHHAIVTSSTPIDMEVYRGIVIPEREKTLTLESKKTTNFSLDKKDSGEIEIIRYLESIISGKNFSFGGFVSTTLDCTRALDFAQEFEINGNAPERKMKIILPAGSRSISLMEFKNKGLPEEMEILLSGGEFYLPSKSKIKCNNDKYIKCIKLRIDPSKKPNDFYGKMDMRKAIEISEKINKITTTKEYTEIETEIGDLREIQLDLLEKIDRNKAKPNLVALFKTTFSEYSNEIMKLERKIFEKNKKSEQMQNLVSESRRLLFFNTNTKLTKRKSTSELNEGIEVKK